MLSKQQLISDFKEKRIGIQELKHGVITLIEAHKTEEARLINEYEILGEVSMSNVIDIKICGALVQIPVKLYDVFLKQKARYKIAFGGRAGAKTDSTTIELIIELLTAPKSTQENKIPPFVVLVVRETLTSIRDSAHATFMKYIHYYNLQKYFRITEGRITCILNNGYVAFKGIRNNPAELKSFQGCMRCWVEEADNVSKNSWDILIPTIRAEGSEIWVTFNPKNWNDDTYQRFIVEPQLNSLLVNVNYYDNPFNSDSILQEISNWKTIRPEDYAHIYLGEVKQYSDALIFKGKFEVKEFITPNYLDIWNRKFYYGADWGFSQDPTCIVRSFIMEELVEGTDIKVKNLYVDYEAGGVGVEITQIKDLFRQIPDIERYCKGEVVYTIQDQLAPITIFGDSARPDIISYLRNQNLPVRECFKTKIEDGIEFLKGFYKIYIHPRCKKILKEFENYSFKIDKNNNKILPEIDTKAGYDHCLIGSTIINTTDGPRTIKSLIDTEGTVFCYDTEKKCTTFSRFHRVRRTQRNTNTLKIITEDNRIIRATPYHLILLLNGWRYAHQLKVGNFIIDIPLSLEPNEMFSIKFVRIKAIESPRDTEDVYNMEVDTYENFSIENGLIVHNCIDSLRYSLSDLIKGGGGGGATAKDYMLMMSQMGKK